MIVKEWDYKGWEKYTGSSEPDYFTQKDWNMTIIAILNSIGVESDLKQDEDVVLMIPAPLKGFFESLMILNYHFNYILKYVYDDLSHTVRVNDNATLNIKRYEPINTDLDGFLNLYNSIGIDLEIDVRPDKKNPEIFLTLNEETSELFQGYGDNGSEIVFDIRGKFIKQKFIS